MIGKKHSPSLLTKKRKDLLFTLTYHCVASNGSLKVRTLSGDLVASVEGIPTQSPEFKPWYERAILIWKKPPSSQRSPTCCHKTILDGTTKLHAASWFRGQHEPLNKKRGVTLKNLTCDTNRRKPTI